MTLTNYWWLLGWLLLAGVILTMIFPKQPVVVMGKKEYRWGWLPAIILVLPYIIWAGFRTDSMIGDTASYRAAFMAMPTEVSGWSEFLIDVTKDKGFSVLSLIIKLFVGNSSILYFLIIAAFQILVVAMIYRKYSCNYWLSIFLFIATTDYISWVNNGVRQFVAVTIIFAATGLLLKRKYIPVILLILLASTMHQSALLMIPIIFIIQGKAWNKKTILLIVACVAALFFVDQFTDILDTALADTQYTNVVSDWQSWNDDGTNPLRVLVYSVPTILSLLGIKWIRRENDPVINLAANASIISTGLYIVSMGTSGIFLGRLPIYTSLYATGILLPWEISHMFTKSSARIITAFAVILFAAFFYYQMHGWGLM